MSQEFATQLTFLSEDTRRLVGALVDRKGKVEEVIIGDAFRLYLPDVGRQRAGAGRLRGLRLIRSNLQGEPLGRDDLTDLSKLHLDAIVSVQVGPGGYPARFHWAHLVPENPGGALWQTANAHAAAELLPDFQTFISELEAELGRKRERTVETAGERAILIMPQLPGGRKLEAELGELRELARTAGLHLADVIVQRRPQADPRFVIGKGKLEDVVLQALQQDVELLVFGCDLAPRQMRAITDATDLRVIDRTQLILDIFAQHATSADGKLQVELAQLKYTLPRLIAKSTGMSRLTGGVGGRGPGETKLELNRRRANDRLRFLEDRLKQIAAQRIQQRSRRKNNDALPILSIVGYTNAGKSTLLNSLTRSDVLSEDKLFATLAPASRRLRFPEDREVVLTDTVGFIHDLPRDLVNAFKATLEELDDADLLLHVVDVSTTGFEERMRAVNKILDDLELSAKPQILVFNKCDLIDEEEAAALAAQHGAVAISALRRDSAHSLIEAIDRRLFFEAAARRPVAELAEDSALRSV